MARGTFRDLRNRAEGLLAGTPSGFLPHEVPDEVLHDQIRSRLSRVVSHPGAIDVAVRNGRVSLFGPILEEELAPLLAELSSLRGIRDFQDTLKVHGGHEVPSSLQAVDSPERIRAWKRDTWPPALRLAAGSAGGALLLAAARKGKVATGALAGTGTALLLRAAFNMPWSRIAGVGAGRTAVDVRKSIHVDAPVE